MDDAQCRKRDGLLQAADQSRRRTRQPGRDIGAPVIVSAFFGGADFAWLDGLRRAHYPAERNRVPAHLTLLQHLPPAIEPELRDRLVAATRGVRAPAARVAAVMRLDQGVALRVESPALAEIRDELAEHFHGLLIAQDQAGWRAHVTIQNKVSPREARALAQALESDFRPRSLAIAGLAAWRYRGGPWEALSRHHFD